MSDADRVVAWQLELQVAHRRLRAALSVARESLTVPADLLLYCHGFCAALDGHHRGEDAALFPSLVAEFPHLRPVIEKLQQDHVAIAGLLASLSAAVAASASPAVLTGHLDGLAAIMDSHFGYEERELLGPLASLQLDADPADVLGPLVNDESPIP